MKKLILSLGACSLAFAAPVAVPTAAVAQADNSSIVNVCKAFQADDPAGFQAEFGNLGQCASYPAKVCNALKKEGDFPIDLGDGTVLRNQGDCVNFLKAAINANN
jgi:hypothetical protein